MYFFNFKSTMAPYTYIYVHAKLITCHVGYIAYSWAYDLNFSWIIQETEFISYNTPDRVPCDELATALATIRPSVCRGYT